MVTLAVELTNVYFKKANWVKLVIKRERNLSIVCYPEVLASEANYFYLAQPKDICTRKHFYYCIFEQI